MKVNEKYLSLPCLYKEKSCVKGMKLNSGQSQAIWNKYFNIDIFILNLPSHRRVSVCSINIIISISVCKFKFTGVRLREWPRSIKNWTGSQWYAPKVFPQGYLTPDNGLWLCRSFLNQNIC